MIKNERQYQITRRELERFERTLAELEAEQTVGELLPAALREAERGALRGQIESLRGELAEYDVLSSGQVRSFTLDSFDALPGALIRARIARGLTQRQLAERLGLREQQIQRYEATDYASASLTRVCEIIIALGLIVREEVVLAGD
jgi:DNA-binding XRE family transcriptional regulator